MGRVGSRQGMNYGDEKGHVAMGIYGVSIP